jgi:hypothetical protein
MITEQIMAGRGVEKKEEGKTGERRGKKLGERSKGLRR